jgi:hypothetical protein
VQKYAPQAYFVFHDSFRYDPSLWNDMFADGDTDKIAMDHHYYQCFVNPPNTVWDACNAYEKEG